MNLSEIVIVYRQDHGLSQRQFADQCGLSNGYISMLEKGFNPKTGEPLKPQLPSLKKLARGMGTTVHDLFANADDLEVDMSAPGFEPLPKTVRIPLVGSIACGEPITAEENVEDFVDAPAERRADFALRCHGDSMIDAGISDGDIVYIRIQPEVSDGQIAAVRIGDEATLKRVYWDGDTLTLVPANSQYVPKTYRGQDLENVRIEGLAVGFTHWF